MKLLDEIIDLLADESTPLSSALLKTKVLLHRIGQQELVEWVDQELEGYGSKDLPSYRVKRGRVMGDLVNMVARFTNHPLPVLHLEADFRNAIETIKFSQSISSIEKLASSGDSLQKPLALEGNELLGRTLTDGTSVERAWVSLPTTEALQILVQVRSRLLGFALKLGDELKDVPEDKVAHGAAVADAGSIFRHVVIGDNATVILGSHNIQTVNSHNRGGDIEGLVAALRKARIDEEHLTELRRAIERDAPTVDVSRAKAGKFGPAVNGWIASQFSRAANAAWNIELGIAGNLLTTALQNYYG